MPKYQVQAVAKVPEYYSIEADTPSEAMEHFLDGDYLGHDEQWLDDPLAVKAELLEETA